MRSSTVCTGRPEETSRFIWSPPRSSAASVFLGSQLPGSRPFGRLLWPGRDVPAASVLTDPHDQAPGGSDLQGDSEQYRERQQVQPAAGPGEQADPRPDAEQPETPERLWPASRGFGLAASARATLVT
jgi:hypothetical protein